MANRDEPDFLDELIADYTAEDPNFPTLLAEADARRAAFRALAAVRDESNISQTAAAAAMRTSQSALGRLETTATDARISTLQRYAHALGMKLQLVFVPEESDAEPVVVRGARGVAARAASAATAAASAAKAAAGAAPAAAHAARAAAAKASASGGNGRSTKATSSRAGVRKASARTAAKKTSARSSGTKRSGSSRTGGRSSSRPTSSARRT